MPVLGKKAVLEWCTKEGLIGSSYVCPKCGKTRRVARQLGRSDCVLKRCWDQWIREISFTRRPNSGHPRKSSRREDRHIVRNSRVQRTASSATLQALIAPTLGTPVSSQTVRRRLHEGHLES
ncbi:HTH_Tnp_Tc3_2 domain-containing protein [Trichonephila clavipes]|nr:HTH_Tnp_Tc3_2 domain-containing protein [Trichonephila clavipes]